MRLRRNILPRRLVDWLCFLLIGVFLPIVYIFEITVVLPAFHKTGGILHTFTFIVAMFLLFNIVGNMVGCMLIDTSVDFKKLHLPQHATKIGWRFCDDCNNMAPPRSWHCKICRACILKRDHHCYFTGCCIGNENHRYFTMFVVYLFIGSTYALTYNSVYLWILNADKYLNLLSVLKILCPAFYVLTGSIWHDRNLYLIYYSLNLLAVFYSVLLLFYHGQTILRGGVCYERDKGYPYSNGDWKQNLRSVLGKRFHLAWLSPLVVSELPDNGIDWKVQKIFKSKKVK